MASVVAFDSKEFNVKGVFKDFFCPIGIGVRFGDEEMLSAPSIAARSKPARGTGR